MTLIEAEQSPEAIVGEILAEVRIWKERLEKASSLNLAHSDGLVSLMDEPALGKEHLEAVIQENESVLLPQLVRGIELLEELTNLIAVVEVFNSTYIDLAMVDDQLRGITLHP
jgi:hypothetical protein